MFIRIFIHISLFPLFYSGEEFGEEEQFDDDEEIEGKIN